MRREMSHLQQVTTTALLAALVFVVTYSVRIPIPFTAGGYLNMGDTVIYLAGFLAGGPIGAVAAGLGSSLADILAGYAVYALPTLVIKGMMGLVVGILTQHDGFTRFLLSSALGGAIMVFGYAAFEALFFSPAYALAAIPFNALQGVGGVVVAAILYPALSKHKNLILHSPKGRES